MNPKTVNFDKRKDAHTVLKNLLFTLALVLMGASSVNAQSLDEPMDEPLAEPEVRGTFDDWVVRCGPADPDAFGAEDICEMYQQVSEQESGQTVLEMVIGYPPGESELVALMSLPLGIRLPPGGQLRVEDREPVSFPIQICIDSGCRADVALDEETVSAMRSGMEAAVVIADPQGRGVALPISLRGFSAALDELEGL